MAMLKFSRLLIFVARYLECQAEFGASTAYKVFVGARLSSQTYVITLSQQHLKLYIRGKTTDASVFRSIFLQKEYPFLAALNPKVIIDAGANCGLASVYFHTLYPNAKIFALEPEPSNFKALTENTSQISQIKPFHAALWYNNSPLHIQGEAGKKVSFTMSEHGDDEVIIQSVTLKDIFASENISDIDILKLDIEGAEKEIFEADDTEWLCHVKVIFIELHDNKGKRCGEAFFKSVTGKGFLYFVSGENIVLIKKSLDIVI